MLLDTFGNVIIALQEIEQTGLFPFPFSMHLVFCLISLVFFTWRFSKEKKPYQIILAFAIPLSMILWFFENDKPKFQMVGLVEGVLLLAAFISTFFGKKEPKEETAEAVKTAETDGDEKPAENSGEEKSE